MYIKLNSWSLTKDEEQGYTVRGVIMGIPICVKRILKREYIRIGIILYKRGVRFLCEYGRRDTSKELPD